MACQHVSGERGLHRAPGPFLSAFRGLVDARLSHNTNYPVWKACKGKGKRDVGRVILKRAHPISTFLYLSKVRHAG